MTQTAHLGNTFDALVDTILLLWDAQDKLKSVNIENDNLKDSMLNTFKYASSPSLDNVSQMSEALKWIIEEGEAVLTTKQTTI